MKYYLFLLRSMLPEWRDGYIDYRSLKQIMRPFKTYRQSSVSPFESFFHLDFHPTEKQYFNEVSDIFNEALKAEIVKFVKFAEFQVFQSSQQWLNLMHNTQSYDNSDQNIEKRKKLMDIFHQFYSKLHYLERFLDLNQQIITQILKKYAEKTEPFTQEFTFEFLKKDEVLNSANFTAILKKLTELLKDFKQGYKTLFYTEKTRSEASKTLKNLMEEKKISKREGYFLCFFTGFSTILVLVIMFLAIEGHFEDKSHFFSHIFPIFRGGLFIVLYIFLLAFNVYVWNRYNINYRRIFKFNHHYSTLSQILKRGMFFYSVLLLTFLWYVLIKADLGLFSRYLDFLPDEIIICSVFWVLLFGYMFFPSKRYFNGDGRLYVFNLLKRILFMSMCHVDFCINWATDQMVSFVTPLKDLEYTLCFFIESGLKVDENEIKAVCSQKTIYIGFAAAAIPLFLRMIQCMRSLRQGWNKPDYFYHILNFLKYLCSFCVTGFSFLSGTYDSNYFFAFWVIFAVISTLYSYSWDIKVDWGLLKDGRNLREKLLYSKKYYYMAIVSNFIFRCSWVLTISNGVNPFGLQKELFTLICGFIEMLRRAIWNFLRVEKEHIFNTDLYKLYEEVRMPQNLQPEINQSKREVSNIGEFDFVAKGKMGESFLRETLAESINIDVGGMREDTYLWREFEVTMGRARDVSRKYTNLMERNFSKKREIGK